MTEIPSMSPLACLLALFGVGAMYSGGAAAVAQEHLSRPSLAIAILGMSSLLAAGWLQTAVNRVPKPSRRIEIQVTLEKRLQFATLLGAPAMALSYGAAFLLNLPTGQSMYLSLLGLLLGAALGYAATPALMVNEARNPSGFRFR